jgi:hypothetical protein
MMNGRELNREVTRAGGVVEEAMRANYRGGKVDVNGVLDDLFLTALNRHPTQAELAALRDVQNGTVAAARDDKKDDKKDPKKPDPKSSGTVVLGTSTVDKRFYQDVFWALLNTTEFMLNH